MDFNKHRQIIRSLNEKKKNPLLFIPCVIAILAVSLVFNIAVRADMSLSDKDGNFLGMKKKARTKARNYDSEMAKLAEAAMKSAPKDKRSAPSPDDFSPREKKHISGKYTYHPLWTRFVSGGLAAAFAMMLMPAELVGAVSAKTNPGGVYTVPNTNKFAPSEPFKNDTLMYLSELDFSTNYGRDAEYAVNFNRSLLADSKAPMLTTMTVGYSLGACFDGYGNTAVDENGNPVDKDGKPIKGENGKTITGNPFTAQGALNNSKVQIYIKNAETFEEFDNIRTAIGERNTSQKYSDTLVLWDYNDVYYNQIPDEVENLTVKSSANGKLILEWDPPKLNPDGTKPNNYPNGYYIYTSKSQTVGMSKKYTTFTFKDMISMSKVHTTDDGRLTITLTPDNTNDELFYGIRAYRSADLPSDFEKPENFPNPNFNVASKLFEITDEPIVPIALATPVVSASVDNSSKTVKLTITFKDAASELPDYVVLFREDPENKNKYLPLAKFTGSDVSPTILYDDPDPYDGTDRKYIAAAYYDMDNEGLTLGVSDHTLPSGTKPTEKYAVTKSEVANINNLVLDKPINVIADPSSDSTAMRNFLGWNLTWTEPAKNAGVDNVTYTVGIRRPTDPENTFDTFKSDVKMTDLPLFIPSDADGIQQGYDVEFVVFANEKKPYAESEHEIVPAKVTDESVDLQKALGKNSIATLTFAAAKLRNNSKAYDQNYIIFYREKGTKNANPLSISLTGAQNVSEGIYSYDVKNLKNGVTYEFWITCPDSCRYPSKILEATPSEAPQPPASITPDPKEYGVDLKWDKAYVFDEKGNPIREADGYKLTVIQENGTVIGTWDNLTDTYFNIPTTGPNAVSLENEKNYIAEVSSYIIVNDIRIDSLSSTKSVEFTPTITVMDIGKVDASVENEVNIRVKWTAVPNATRYYLARKGEDGSYNDYIDLGNTTTYLDTAVTNKVNYTYYVYAVREADGHVYQQAKPTASAPTFINVFVDMAHNLQKFPGDGTVTITWDDNKEADGYLVEQRHEGVDSDFTNPQHVKGTSYTLTGLANKEEYTFRVTPYRMVNNFPVYSTTPATTTAVIGAYLSTPMGFKVTPGDGKNTLTWDVVKEADGYDVFVKIGDTYQRIDRVAKPPVVHTNLTNGTTITYAVRAYKVVNGEEYPSDYSDPKTVTVGVAISAPTDVTATAGDKQVTLKWKKVNGATGYVVYCYDLDTSNFVPVGVVTSTNFTHTNLVNGRTYTYMIRAYKDVDGETVYSTQYSLSVSATPEGKDNGSGSGSGNNGGSGGNGSGGNGSGNGNNASDQKIYITGTTPYGLSNSNLISAFVEKGAVTQDVDLRFTLDGDDITRLDSVLNFYGAGLESFLTFPMNISLYIHGTDTPAVLNPGSYMTITIPVPDEMLEYSQYISVVHVSHDDQLEILPSTHVTVNGVDCIQFTATSFSVYGFVVYLPDTGYYADEEYYGEDLSSGSFMGSSSIIELSIDPAPVFMCTTLPELYRRRIRNKVFRIKSRTRR